MFMPSKLPLINIRINKYNNRRKEYILIISNFCLIIYYVIGKKVRKLEVCMGVSNLI